MPRSRGSLELTQAQRGEIIGRIAQGATALDIARSLGIDKRTVKKWIRRHEADDSKNWAQNKKRTGRPRSTTPAQDAHLIHEVRSKPIRHNLFLVTKPFNTIVVKIP